MELHPIHHFQQQHPTAPTPPPSHTPLVDQDLKRRPIVPLSFSNGALKKHRPLYHPPPPLLPHNHVVYRECLKNHAASLGGHALDGCGDFMPSPDATPADPASLTCAACGCHRNFHRRALHGGGDLSYPHREEREVVDDGAAEDDGDEAVDDDDDDDDDARGSTPPHAGAAAHQYYSAPHMLMALSAGVPGGPSGSPSATAGSAGAATHVTGGSNPASAGGGLQLPRKRFRTKFSSMQKERMQELSERLGWRMQRRDEALVEECCREIGVSRGVFKVWMHNNKHNFVSGPSSRRAGGGGATVGDGVGRGGGGEATSSSGGGIEGGGGIASGANGVEVRKGVGEEQNGGGRGGDGHGLNSSSPSS